jgi:inner membrane transporter RhtA
MFDRAGAAGAAWLRLLVGAALVALVAAPGTARAPRRPGALAYAVGLGLCLAAMNTAFYGAIERLPLGVAVAIEFTGPLAVALAATRRPSDVVWVAIAAASVAALTLPRADLGEAEGLGVLLALVAGGCWALYIVAAAGLGRRWPGPRGLAVALAAGALVTTPGGLVATWGGVSGELFLAALGVGLLGTAVPYSLELAALRRLSRGAFGIMMAAEPAVATLVGVTLLTQTPSALELAGITGVTVAVWGTMARG